MKTLMRTALLFSVLLVFSILHAGERVWTSSDGKNLPATLVSYDLEAGEVKIKTRQGKDYTLPLTRLSEEDRVYLRELAEKDKAEREAREKAVGERAGKVSSEKTDAGNSFHVYYPKSYSLETKPPLLILFSPGGQGRGMMKNFMRGSDALGWVLVGCDKLKNGMDDKVGDAIFSDLLPEIEERVDHDPARIYLGGFSGGAMRAYRYTAKFERPWKGVVACGGWLGGEEYFDLAYAKRMAVAIVNGENDRNANSWIDRDSEVLKGRRAKVEVFKFPGGHQVGPPDVMERVMTWLQENTHIEGP